MMLIFLGREPKASEVWQIRFTLPPLTYVPIQNCPCTEDRDSGTIEIVWKNHLDLKEDVLAMDTGKHKKIQHHEKVADRDFGETEGESIGVDQDGEKIPEAQPVAVDTNGIELWDMEAILDTRMNYKTREYLVHWEGTSSASNTWSQKRISRAWRC